MIFLDSSFFIAMMFPEDKNHIRSLELYHFLKHENGIINNTVLVEVLNTISRYNSRINPTSLYETLMENYFIDYLQAENYNKAFNKFDHYNYSINYSNCTILETMENNDVNKIVTFDPDFKKVDGLIVIE